MACLRRPSLWREAATLIIASNCTKGSCKETKFQDTRLRQGQDFEILVLKRSGRVGFFPNTFVFPGGSVEKQDFDEEWLSIIPTAEVKKTIQNGYPYSRNIAPRPTILCRPWSSRVPNEIAFRITALRETFEEAGCLLIRCRDSLQLFDHTILPKESKSRLRKRVQSDPREFIKVCRELNCYPDVSSLFEWSNWLTPARSNRRYDTLFFVSCREESLVVSHDDYETVQHNWVTTREALKQYREKEILFPPPQLYELTRMNRFPSFDYLQHFSAQRAHQFPTERWLPVQIHCTDGLLSVLPGDQLYPQNAVDSAADSDSWMEDEWFVKQTDWLKENTTTDHTHETRHVNCFSVVVRDIPEGGKASQWVHALQLHINAAPSQGHLMPIVDIKYS